MISNETVKEFQSVVELELGTVLDEKEATEILANLVGYFDLLAKIDHRDKVQASHSTSN